MTERTRKPYPSDLTDDQWNILEPLIPPEIGKGENRKVDLREVINGILYIQRTGVQWDYIPLVFLPKEQSITALASKFSQTFQNFPDKGTFHT